MLSIRRSPAPSPVVTPTGSGVAKSPRPATGQTASLTGMCRSRYPKGTFFWFPPQWASRRRSLRSLWRAHWGPSQQKGTFRVSVPCRKEGRGLLATAWVLVGPTTGDGAGQGPPVPRDWPAASTRPPPGLLRNCWPRSATTAHLDGCRPLGPSAPPGRPPEENPDPRGWHTTAAMAPPRHARRRPDPDHLSPRTSR